MGATADDPVAAAPGRGAASPVRVLTLTMAAVAAVVVAALVATSPAAWPPAVFWGLLPLFFLTETRAIHLPTERHAHSHTLREIPAVVGLATLAPLPYVAAYVVGAGLSLLLVRRQRGTKLVFNLAMFALEAAAGLACYRLVLGDGDPAEPRGWVAALLAVLVTDAFSAAAVTAAISLSEARFDGAVLREAVVTGVPAAMANASLALLVVVLLDLRPAALPLLVTVLLMLFLAYRGYVSLASGYSRLRLLYQFVGAAGRALHLADAGATVLAEARTLMRAERADLVLLPHEGRPGARSRISADGKVTTRPLRRTDADPDAWWAAAATGETVLRSRPRRTASAKDAAAPVRGPRDGIAAPLRTGGRVTAVLLVTNRTFREETFGAEDLRLFETLAAHASVALDHARAVDDLRDMAEEQRRAARRDTLTRLPNRLAFLEALAEAVTGRDRGAVLLMDLDDFKDINDTLGHGAGDQLLAQCAVTLHDAVDGFVARLGGDEFGVLLRGVDPDAGEAVAHTLRGTLAHPVSLDDVTVTVSASIGMADITDDGTDAAQVLRHADVAMYAAKANRAGFARYRPEDSTASHRRLVLATDLAAAVRDCDYDVWYQPQADARTGLTVGVESLLRWTHPRYGPIPPPEVLSLANRIGLLRELTDGILRTALEQRARWDAAGHPLTVSVNVTPRDVSDAALPDVVRDVLARTDTPPDALTLEITEDAAMTDPARALAVLDALAASLVHLSIDDFGTGYSSLAYLERLPVHEVKIDRSFVQRLERGDTEATVVRATVTLAHDLGLRVVAEGVESGTAWQRVADLGCEVVQGYGLARPMPAGEASAWLAARADLPPR